MDEIEKQIRKNSDLIRQIEEAIAVIEIPSDNQRAMLFSGFFQNTMTHFLSINILINKKLYDSAFALERVFFESMLRGQYLAYILDDTRVNKMYIDDSDWEFPSLKKMGLELDSFFDATIFTKILTNLYTVMCGYTHTGKNPIARHFNESTELITANFSQDLILDTLKGNYTLMDLLGKNFIYFMNVNGLVCRELNQTIEEKIAAEQYVCSLIDILGQKEKLNEINDIDFKHDVHKVKEILKKTYGAVACFRDNMHDSVNFVNQIKKNHNINTGFTSNPIQIKSFSDLISSYVSLRDDKNELQFEGIFFLMFSHCEVFLKMLGDGIALRGGIDIGIGLKLNDNEIYGTALLNPYILESKVAKSIRVVVGQKLYDYICDVAKEKVVSNESLDYNIAYAKLCKKIIIQDSDGEYILDYLSDEFKEMAEFDVAAKKAKYFLDERYNDLREKHEYEVVKKYKEAIKYFEKNEIK